MDAASRLDWLSLQEPVSWDHDVWPQPYEQLAKVLRESGYEPDARSVLAEFERRQMMVRVKRYPNFLKPMALLGEALYSGSVDRGRQPLRAFAWLGLMLLIGTLVFWRAELDGALKPNSPVILRSPEWVECAAGGTLRLGGGTQLACFLRQPQARSYPRINAFV
jgi:hypothetical protein